MLYQLIKRDPAWRLAPKLVLACAILAPAIALYNLTLEAVIPCVGLMPLLAMYTKPHQRCTFFEATLPLRAKDLYLARVLSLLALCWLPIGVGVIGIVAATGDVRTVSRYLLELGGLFSLFSLILLSARPREFASPPSLTLVLSISFCALIVLVVRLMWPDEPDPVVVFVLCAAASAVLFTITWTALPASFQVQEKVAAAPSAPKSGRSFLPRSWAPVVRSIGTWRSVLYLFTRPYLVVITNGLIAPVFMLSIGETYATLRWLTALPVSRRKLLLLSLLPAMTVVLSGLAIAALIPENSVFPDVQLTIFQCGSDSRLFDARGRCLSVNLAYWNWSIGNPKTSISAPWGETYPAESQDLRGFTLTNPWSVPANSSARFFDWQLSRATQAIYGRPISRETLQRTGYRAIRPVVRSPRMAVAGAGFFTAWGLILVFIINLRAWSRFLGRPKSALWLSRILLSASIGIMFLPTYVIGISRGFRIPSDALLFRLSNILPVSLTAVTALTLAVVLAVYWLLEKQFEEIELFTLVPTRASSISK